MTSCLGPNNLVAVGAAVDWHVDEALDHLRNCAVCREELARLASVHGVLTAQETPRAGFTDDVMADLVATETRRASARRLISISLTPILAGATAFFSIAMAATGPSPVRVGPVAIAAAIGVALVTGWWDRKRMFVNKQSLAG